MSTAGRLVLTGILLPVLLLGQDPTPDPVPGVSALPSGRGSLNQDEVTLRLQSGSLDIRVLPLDSAVIRLLTPDTELALRTVLDRRSAAIDSAARRQGLATVGMVLVTFFARDNNTRFDPQLVTLTIRSRVLQPRATVPLTPGFSGQVLDRRGQAMGLLLYEESLPVTEPFTVQYLEATNRDWERRLPRLMRERARILALPGAD